MLMRIFAIAWIAGLLLAPAAQAQRRPPEQDGVRDMRMAGALKSLKEIERLILPRMSGCDYLGPEFDHLSGIYRLKFVRGGQVIWIDVDGRTGAIVDRYGR